MLRFRSALFRAEWLGCRRRHLFLSGHITALCACLWLPSDGAAVERTVDLELVLAADISDSMDLEIAGAAPIVPLVRLASNEVRPPCDAGEQRLPPDWMFDFN
jgi:hypothetical protein